MMWLFIWKITSKYNYKFLKLWMRIDKFNKRIHAKWRKKFQCQELVDGEKCIIGTDQHKLFPTMEHITVKMIKESHEERYSRPYVLEVGKPTTIPVSAWYDTPMLPISVRFEGDTYAAALVAWARPEDVKYLSLAYLEN